MESELKFFEKMLKEQRLTSFESKQPTKKSQKEFKEHLAKSALDSFKEMKNRLPEYTLIGHNLYKSKIGAIEPIFVFEKGIIDKHLHIMSRLSGWCIGRMSDEEMYIPKDETISGTGKYMVQFYLDEKSKNRRYPTFGKMMTAVERYINNHKPRKSDILDTFFSNTKPIAEIPKSNWSAYDTIIDDDKLIKNTIKEAKIFLDDFYKNSKL